jgi:protein-L-isoaspartate(D-aspartate) O-methyltransferase
MDMYLAQSRVAAVCVALVCGLRAAKAGSAPQARVDYATARDQMVDREIVAAGVKNPRVIAAMRATPRHEFVPAKPAELREKAYLDMALPIGEGQTISPPFIVAYMTEQLDPQPTDKVLEIGTGSGYQAAVLSGLVAEVYTIEIVESLGRRAAKELKRLKYRNVYTKIGDGYEGWPEHAPFDKIIVTCSPERIPTPLVEQLKEGGRMIIPVGQRYQQVFYLLKKTGGKMETEALRPTLFVPMTGEAERRRKVKPDPLHPAIVNGDFEQSAGTPEEAVAWHYQRQMELVSDPAIPARGRYATFSNTEPGRHAQALQGFAVDGRRVRFLKVSAMVRGEEIRAGQNASELPCVGITFFDENRAPLGEGGIGPWRGSFGWKRVEDQIPVPPKAREAIIRIGLFGATGKVSFDAIQVEAAVAKSR